MREVQPRSVRCRDVVGRQGGEAVRIVQPPPFGPVWSYRARLAVLTVTAVVVLLVVAVGSGPEQLPMDPGTPPEVKLIGTRP